MRFRLADNTIEKSNEINECLNLLSRNFDKLSNTLNVVMSVLNKLNSDFNRFKSDIEYRMERMERKVK